MWLILILAGLAMIFVAANRIDRMPRPVLNIDQISWQADLHFETALERLKDSIEQDKRALKSPKTRKLLANPAAVREHMQALEKYRSWLESIRGTYNNLAEQYSGDSKRQRRLLNNWRQFTDAVWARSNNDQWQRVYMDYGLPIEDTLYESAELYSTHAEETANRLLKQVKLA